MGIFSTGRRMAMPVLLIALIEVFLAGILTIVSADTSGSERQTILASKNIEVCREVKQIDFAQAANQAVHGIIQPCEIIELSIDNLRVVRNTIFAKYGRDFKDEKLRSYFRSQPWYTVRPDYSDDLLDPQQRRNAIIIQNVEDLKRTDNIDGNLDIIVAIN